MEPFTSNDIYVCPDCGSEVRVGARSCPGCGPFRAMDWSDKPHEPTGPFHSQTTYTDTREVLERSRKLPMNQAEPVIEAKAQNFQVIFTSLLVVLTLLAAAMAAFKLLRF